LTVQNGKYFFSDGDQQPLQEGTKLIYTLPKQFPTKGEAVFIKAIGEKLAEATLSTIIATVIL